MFENIDTRKIITPDMVEKELEKHNDILDDKYKGFIYLLV